MSGALVALIAVYAVGFGITVAVLCDEDGPIAVVLALLWPLIGAVSLGIALGNRWRP